jgi:hypothetical protein
VTQEPPGAPRPRKGVRFEELDGESVVYDRSGKRATYLNDTATLIWKLCDGTRGIPEIVDLLGKEYPESAGALETDVRDTITRLVAKRVLVLGQEAPPTP